MTEHRPLYQRIRGKIVAMILEDRLADNDALPSVRALAAELKANPLTVAKAYSTLQDRDIIEARRGVGYFVTAGGKTRLREIERRTFLVNDWPAITREIRRLGIDPAILLKAANQDAC